MLPVLLLGGAVILGALVSGCSEAKKIAKPDDPKYIEATPHAIENAGTGPCAHWVYGDDFINKIKAQGLVGKDFSCEIPRKGFWSFQNQELNFSAGNPTARGVKALKAALTAAPRLGDGTVDFSELRVQHALRGIFDNDQEKVGATLFQIKTIAQKIQSTDPSKKFTVLGHSVDYYSMTNMAGNLTDHRAEVVREILVGYGVDPSRVASAGTSHFAYVPEKLSPEQVIKFRQDTSWVAVLPRD